MEKLIITLSFVFFFPLGEAGSHPGLLPTGNKGWAGITLVNRGIARVTKPPLSFGAKSPAAFPKRFNTKASQGAAAQV